MIKKINIRILVTVLLLSLMSLSGCDKQLFQTKSQASKSNSSKILRSPTSQVIDVKENLSNMVFFDFDRYDLPTTVGEILSEQVSLLLANENLHVVVEGHADRWGPRDYNISLSDKRAEKIRRHLIACGVSADKIRTVAFGKEKLFSHGTTPEDDQKNRRAVILITESKID